MKITKLSVGDAVNINGELQGIKNNLVDIKGIMHESLNIKVKYRLGRLNDHLVPIVKRYNEEREELLKLYGTVNEEKKIYDFTPENAKLYNEAFAALIAEKEDVIHFEFYIEDFDFDTEQDYINFLNRICTSREEEEYYLNLVNDDIEEVVETVKEVIESAKPRIKKVK